jgi:hypothetical protein
MTADRCLELLRELHRLQVVAHHLATFDCRRETRPTWDAIAIAIDDRCALLRAVLVLEADADVLVACDLRLAREQAGSGDAPTALDASPLALDENGIGDADLPRVTIH